MSRALVCSGGGSLGAWQGGAIQALADQGVTWTHFAGVSVGALNASYMSQFDPVYQKVEAENLRRLWFAVNGNSDVYKAHAPGFLKWIWQFWKRSLYTMKPLENMVESKFNPTLVTDANNKLLIGVTDLNRGQYESVSINASFTRREAAKAIHASSVFPGLFEPVAIDGKGGNLYIDGGVRHTIPILDVLTPDVTEVDIVLTSPRAHFTETKSFKSAIDVGLHAANIMAHEVYITDLQVVCANKYDVKLNIYEPGTNLGQDPFDFDPKAIREMWFKGYQTIR